MQAFLTKNRWAVLLTATLAQCIGNFPIVWGVFQPYVSQAYGYSQDAAAMVMPLCLVFFGVFSIFGGRVQDTRSPRIAAYIGAVVISASFFIGASIPTGSPLLMYLGFSLFFGAGYGFINAGLFTCVMKWYADKKGFAGGVMGSAASVFSILLTYLAEGLLSRFGPRMTLAYIGGACLLITLVTSFFYVNPSEGYILEKSSISSGKGAEAGKGAPIDFTTTEMLRTRQYYLLILCIILAMPVIMLINPSLVSICMERGLEKSTALNALAIASATSAAGRFLVPWVSDHMGRKHTLLAMLAVAAASAFWFMRAGGFSIVVAFAVLSFAGNGGFAVVGPLTNDLFGFQYAGTNVGFVNISNAVGALSGFLLLPLFTPFFGADARSWVGIIGTVLAFFCILMLSTNMAAVRKKMDEKKAQQAAEA